MSSLERFEKLQEEHRRRLKESTREERVAQATKLVNELSNFGKINFPKFKSVEDLRLFEIDTEGLETISVDDDFKEEQ